VFLFHNPEEAEVSIVKFLIALTAERVAFRSAPFDQSPRSRSLIGRLVQVCLRD
jgi:hypothetical protein